MRPRLDQLSPSKSADTVFARLPIILVAALAMVAMAATPLGAAASEEKAIDAEHSDAGNAMALPNTYRVELTYRDGGETLEFSTVTALRHFSIAPPERDIRFRGRLWLQPDGRELIDFSVELGQPIAQKDGGAAVSSRGQWSGSAYVELDRPIRIVANPGSEITLTLRKQ